MSKQRGGKISDSERLDYLVGQVRFNWPYRSDSGNGPKKRERLLKEHDHRKDACGTELCLALSSFELGMECLSRRTPSADEALREADLETIALHLEQLGEAALDGTQVMRTKRKVMNFAAGIVRSYRSSTPPAPVEAGKPCACSCNPHCGCQCHKPAPLPDAEQKERK